MIELDTQGTVVRADTVGKPDQYSLALCTEMRKWRFRPVLFQGKAVRAKAVLTAVFRPDGSIELPGFN
jgi:hypothetical protein